MSDVTLLCQALAANPSDTTARLVLADALDEADRADEASLLRDETVDILIVDGVIHDAAERTYEYREEGGHTETVDADDMDEAVEMAAELCRGGEWGDEGASVSVWVTEYDATGEETDSRSLIVEIEPDHDAMIRRAGGDPDCDHDWTSEGEGGCDQNPGVWSTGGTSMSFASHCRTCGLHRTEYTCGSQRNPGEHDTVEYIQPDSWCAECQSEECDCEQDDE